MTSHYGKILVMVFQVWGQKVPALRVFWDLEKTVFDEIRVSGTNIPHFHVHKPKSVLVEIVLVIFV